MTYSPYPLVNDSIKRTLHEFNEEFNKINDGTLECILFGSCARGHADGSSDVDIAVISKEEVSRSKHVDIRSLEELGRPPVQIVIIPENRLYTDTAERLYANIRRDGVKWKIFLWIYSHK